MHLPLQFTLESHVTAATLYLSGAVAHDDAVRAFRHCYSLPSRVRHLSVDLRRAYALGPGSLETLDILLDEWRATCGRTARVLGPATHGRANVGRLAPPAAPRISPMPRAGQHWRRCTADARAGAP